jgi:hypothetical protein
MDIFHTKVFSKQDRQRACQALLEELRVGKSLLFHLVDKEGGKISGSQRLAKRFGSRSILGPLYSSKPLFISHFCHITDETDFQQFVALHLDDLQFFEHEIAPLYDQALGRSPSEVNDLMKQFSVREIV